MFPNKAPPPPNSATNYFQLLTLPCAPSLATPPCSFSSGQWNTVGTETKLFLRCHSQRWRVIDTKWKQWKRAEAEPSLQTGATSAERSPATDWVQQADTAHYKTPTGTTSPRCRPRVPSPAAPPLLKKKVNRKGKYAPSGVCCVCIVCPPAMGWGGWESRLAAGQEMFVHPSLTRLWVPLAGLGHLRLRCFLLSNNSQKQQQPHCNGWPQ